MTWLTWRQHRGEALGVAAIIGLLATVVLATGIPMRRAYEADGLAACRRAEDEGPELCQQIVGAFLERFGAAPGETAASLPFVAIFAGVLIGGPLIAREYEQGTWQLVWTQAVPRTRWLLGRLGLVLAAMTTAAVAVSALMTWWLQPLIPDAFDAYRFNAAAPVFPSHVLLALAIGVLAGELIRRTVPAMAVTAGAFLAVRLWVEFSLRPSYRAPLTATTSTDTEAKSANGDWIIGTFFAGPTGAPLTRAEESQLFDTAAQSTGSLGGSAETFRLADAARELGFSASYTYQPADRLWQFQLIETAIFGGLAILLLCVVVWRIRHARLSS